MKEKERHEKKERKKKIAHVLTKGFFKGLNKERDVFQRA